MKKTTVAVIVTLALVLVVARILAPIIIKTVINKKINHLPDMRGHVETVHLHVIRGGITVEDVALNKLEGAKPFPLAKIERVDAYVSWAALFHLELVANVGVVKPQLFVQKIPVVQKPPEQKIQVAVPEIREDPYEIVRDLRKTLPFNISNFKIKDGVIIYKDLTLKPPAQIDVTKLNVDAENLTNSKKVADSLFGTIKVSASILESGETHLIIKVNPTRLPPEFKINFQLMNMDIARLNPFLHAAQDLEVKKGFLDVASEVATANKKVEGYVKPLVHDLKVSDYERDKKEGVGHVIKEKLVGTAAVLIKNQPHKQQGTEIPFHGNIDDPKIGVWPAVGKTISNVIIQALTPNLDHTVKLADVKGKRR